MTLIEGYDYYVYYVRFPNMKNQGAVVPNEDGTYTVYVNTLYPPEMWPGILDHELDHILDDDFYNNNDIRTVEGL